jgi:hypothetical protein
MGLTLYVSLCRLALGIKTIEVLFESALGAFAGKGELVITMRQL